MFEVVGAQNYRVLLEVHHHHCQNGLFLETEKRAKQTIYNGKTKLLIYDIEPLCFNNQIYALAFFHSYTSLKWQK